MKFILGKKLRMSQIFDDNGTVTPVTVIEAGPCSITQVKTKEKDGYEAVQIDLGMKKKEFRIGSAEFKVGDKIEASVFQEGDDIKVSGISKAKGFQGVVKRHGFHGGPRTHGQKHSERKPGSIGSTGPQKVLKGTKMAGRMGGVRVTTTGSKVIRLDKDNDIIAVSGAVPGRRGTMLEIRTEE